MSPFTRHCGLLLSVICVSSFAASIARGDTISVAGTGTQGGAFAGTISYNPNGFAGNTDLAITIKNTATKGTITGFLFNINDASDGAASAAFVSSNYTPDASGDMFGQLDDPSDNNDAVNGPPYGAFEVGVSLPRSFTGGGNGNTNGILVGEEFTFLFEVTNTGAPLTASSFMSAFSTPKSPGGDTALCLVRSKGTESDDDDDSDKVPGHVVPLPAAVWGGLALIGGMGVAKQWRARQDQRV